MASAAHVRKNPQGNRLLYFSRYFDCFTSGIDLFAQKLHCLSEIYCFPPMPIIGKVLKYLMQHKLNCVLILPAIIDTWVNWVSAYIQDVWVCYLNHTTKMCSMFLPMKKNMSQKSIHLIYLLKKNLTLCTRVLYYML